MEDCLSTKMFATQAKRVVGVGQGSPSWMSTQWVVTVTVGCSVVACLNAIHAGSRTKPHKPYGVVA
jgi:hypothetical protein